MIRQGRNLNRFYRLCDEYEQTFGEAFWMPKGLGLSIEDGIYAIKRSLERNRPDNGYDAFDLEPPRQLVV